jgi:hypothetical protein
MLFMLQDVSVGPVQLPLVSLIGALGLIAASAVFTWRLLFQVIALQRALLQIQRRLGRLLTLPAEEIDEERLRKLTEIFEQQPLLASIWAKYRRSLVLDGSRWYETPRVHATQGAADVFTQDALFGHMNISFYRSFPAMLTGVGLLLTFLAFFVGLSKIQVSGTTISGLPGLINGLSGKFVTSIVGLFCASIFAAAEKMLLHRLLTTYQVVVDRLGQVFPHRTATELLFEMTQHQSENARLLKYMGLDIAQHFRKSFSEAMCMPLELREAVRGMKGQGGALTPSSDTLDSGELGTHAGVGQLTSAFQQLEASAVRQEQLLARLADILLPWTEILPKTRIPGSVGAGRRQATSNSGALRDLSQSA